MTLEYKYLCLTSDWWNSPFVFRILLCNVWIFYFFFEISELEFYLVELLLISGVLILEFKLVDILKLKFWLVESVHISGVSKNYNLLLFWLIFQKFPDLKFKYVEEESPEEFFIPYVWSLVYHSSNMYFNASRILLFSLSSSWEHLLGLNTLSVQNLYMSSVHEPEQIIYG